ncbi:MAG: aminotransferase class IV [Verrucomicrobiae bacterium]|nr:aminotransferase class IV [Verrucomicrobiae bacterium]
MQAFFNRRFIPEKQVKISAFDRGFLYGDGLFETMRIYHGGRFFWLDQHLIRLYRSLSSLGIKIPYNRVELEFLLRELVIRNEVRAGFARVVVTRGEGLLGFSPRGAGAPQIIMCARPRNLGVWVRQRPIWRLMVAPSPITTPAVKSLSYLSHVLAKQEAERQGYDEAILMNDRGEVVEVTASNLFIADGKTLMTPPLKCGCLPGITRKAVLKIAQRDRIKVVEKPIRLKDLKNAGEIFITNSMLEVVPCVLGRKAPTKVPACTLAWQHKFEVFRDRNLM